MEVRTSHLVLSHFGTLSDHWHLVERTVYTLLTLILPPLSHPTHACTRARTHTHTSLEWPDDIACAKAVEASQRLLPRLKRLDGQFDEVFGLGVT